MVKLASRETQVKLAIADPREYGVGLPEGDLAQMLYAEATNGNRANYSDMPFLFIEQMARHAAICRSLVKCDDGPFYRALSAAPDYESYSTMLAELASVSCQRRVGDRVCVTFAIPLTLHCTTWPVKTARAIEDWLDFEAIEAAIGVPIKASGPKDLKVIPHLFTLDALTKLPWSAWYALTEQLPLAASGVNGLPTPCSFEQPTEDNRAQARVIVGSFSCSAQAVERFQRNSILNRAENSHMLTRLLQGQLGATAGLKVIAGTPSVALAAISEAQHMLNCARLRCFLDVVENSLDQIISFEAESVKRPDGEGSIRFKTRTLECEWVLQKAEPWAGQKSHWRLFFKNFQAPYVIVQLGLTEQYFDPYDIFDDDDDE